MSDEKSPVKQNWVTQLIEKTPGKGLTLLVLAGIGLLGAIYLLYALLFLGKVYPNVYIGSQKYSGLPYSQVQSRLSAVVEQTLAQPINLTFNDKVYPISAKEANWVADIPATAAHAYTIGRSNGWFHSLLQQLSAPVYPRHLTINANFDDNYLKTTIAAVAEAVDTPPVDATAEYQGNELILTPEKSGETIDQDKVYHSVINQWSSGSNQPIALVRQTAEPKTIVGDEAALKSQATELSQHKLTLKWEGNQKVLTQKDILQLIDFVGQDIGPLDGKLRLNALFTNNKAKAYLQHLSADSINHPAKEPKLGVQQGHLVILEASAEGRVVDVDKSTEAVLAALANAENPVAELSFKVEKPLITADNLDSLGIKEIIGHGETSFVGSPANRRANIANGVRLLQSTLVKPGTEFSTVKTLGAVDGTTGFLPELVIKDNKTTPEFGGGLCQVSTTLFRSVLNAGLKVTERQNHSYRVGYYEPPIGLDATIYLPKPDFKFLNDTTGYLLILGQINGSKITFDIWGTSDGRTSSISTPIVSNILPPPPEVRTDTDTLPIGTVKQTEKAHEGATAVVTYTVMRNGQVINKQTFRSVYKPWAAKFLVGTAPVETPPPTP